MGRRTRKNIGYKKERVILSDVLPYEVPPFFSNRHFYNFLVDNRIHLVNEKLFFKKTNNNVLGKCVKLIFGINKNSPVRYDDENSLCFFKVKPETLKTIPFKFKISHKENDYRELTLIHPINQLSLIPFYDDYKNDIIYHASKSKFSLRKPSKVASLKYFKDSTFNKNKAKNPEVEIIETSDKEYVSLKTFFSYQDYSNIYKFYESHKFHRAEKHFDYLLKFDVSRCFDSIYTHSLPWALLNKRIVKDNLRETGESFGGKFDKLMQLMNYNETNGIVIGPEFSRIFAELILQEIDSKVQADLDYKYKVDYDVYRYVDDFFVFYNDPAIKDEIIAQFKVRLKEYNLFFNDAKTLVIEKPIITQISIAKEEIRDLLDRTTLFKFGIKDEDKLVGVTYNTANDVITNYKRILVSTSTTYKDLQNYFLAAIFNKTKSLINKYQKLEKSLINDLVKEKELNDKLEEELTDEERDKITIRRDSLVEKNEENIKELNRHQRNLDKKFSEIVDLTFFVYSVLPRVSYSIKVCHILYRISDFIKNQEKLQLRITSNSDISFILGKINIGLSFDRKHYVFKSIYDGISIVLKKNGRTKYSEVETLYLLAVLNELGAHYRLSEEALLKHFKLSGTGERTYFILVSLLHYIKNEPGYNSLRSNIKSQIELKVKNFDGNSAEQNILVMDIISCPFLEENEAKSAQFKIHILEKIGFLDSSISQANKLIILDELESFQESWFVKWKQPDLGKELNTKRGHEVY